MFSGLERAHGTYDLSPEHLVIQENGKHKGLAVTRQKPVTDLLWSNHLEGVGAGIGIIPIKEDNTASFVAMDVDVYDSSPEILAKRLWTLKLPLVPVRTKSGGLHAYLFATEPVQAESMRSRMKEMASLMGRPNAEIFPSRSNMDDKSTSNWINMPYYDCMNGLRYGITENGDALEPEEFLKFAETRKQTPQFFSEPTKVSDSGLSDAPPCIETLINIGKVSDNCNNFMTHYAIYSKRAKGDGWQEDVRRANREYIAEPILSRGDIDGVIKSMNAKDYNYTCTKQPMNAYCQGVLCRTRKYGVREADEKSDKAVGQMPVLGGLRKLLVDPPMWFWDVDGRTVSLTTEELQSAKLFQKRVMESCDRMFTLPKSASWETIVDDAMHRMTFIDAPDDSSLQGQLMEHVEALCTGRSQAQVVEEILLGKPFTAEGKTYFRLSDLMRFLTIRNFKDLKTNQIAAVLKSRGFGHEFRLLGKQKKGANLWVTESFAPPIEDLPLPEELLEGAPKF